MNAFIFQAIISKFDLRKEIKPGKIDVWEAKRYRTIMSEGDLVYFWMGGEQSIRGLYGWGNIVSKPYVSGNWDSPGIDVKYQCKFQSAISYRNLKDDPILKDLLIFRNPQATNFLMEDVENKRMIKLIRNLGEDAPEFN